VGIRNADLSFTGDSAVLDKLAASVGKTNLDGRLSVKSFTSPQLDFQLAADRLDVKELQALVAPSQTPSTDSAKPTGTSDSVLLRTTGTGTLSAGSINYDALVLEKVQATATLDHGLIRLDPITAGLFGGTHRGGITVDARKTPPSFAIGSQLERVDANRLASATTSLRDVINGALGTSVRLTFSGDSADNIAKTLNGTMGINLSEGSIANMDLTSEIANVAKFVTGQPRNARSTRVAALRGDFNVQNGLARTENLTAAIEGGTLGATGTVNLVDQSLNLRLNAVLSSDYSQKVGGSRVGGFMNTALANQQGELVVPLIVTGTMSQPRFAPDVQKVAEMRVKSLVPSLKDPGGLTSGILGVIGGQRGGQQGEGAASPGGAIGDILGAVTGRGKAPAQPPAEGNTQKPPAETAKPQQQDRGKQVEDTLRDLLGRRRKPVEEKPAEQPAK
jgi:AsmA protein